jgi:hypothetical protein
MDIKMYVLDVACKNVPQRNIYVLWDQFGRNLYARLINFDSIPLGYRVPQVFESAVDKASTRAGSQNSQTRALASSVNGLQGVQTNLTTKRMTVDDMVCTIDVHPNELLSIDTKQDVNTIRHRCIIQDVN